MRVCCLARRALSQLLSVVVCRPVLLGAGLRGDPSSLRTSKDEVLCSVKRAPAAPLAFASALHRICVSSLVAIFLCPEQPSPPHARILGEWSSFLHAEFRQKAPAVMNKRLRSAGSRSVRVEGFVSTMARSPQELTRQSGMSLVNPS